MRTQQSHRVVITGLGAITPIGNTAPDFWQGLVEGRPGVRLATQFTLADYPHAAAAEVRSFDAREHMDAKTAVRMARFAQFAVVAAGEAIRDSGLDLEQIDRSQVAVNIGTAFGGTAVIEQEVESFLGKGRRWVNAYYMPTSIYNMAACRVAIAYKLHGPTTVPVVACASGAYAIGDAARMIHRGDAQIAVCGGTDASITALNALAFAVTGATIQAVNDPATAVRPFDAQRQGTVGGEGCGILVLEQMEHALARRAHIYAEVAGFAATEDAVHIVAPDPNGEYVALAIRRAIEDAELAPEQIDHIVAHGSATRLNDSLETAAIKQVLGRHAYAITVSGIKSMIGHTAGAAGALAAISCAKTIETGIIPPTINYSEPDPECDLDYVPNAARRARVDVAVANAFGFGGQNAVLIVKRFAA